MSTDALALNRPSSGEALRQGGERAFDKGASNFQVGRGWTDTCVPSPPPPSTVSNLPPPGQATNPWDS